MLCHQMFDRTGDDEVMYRDFLVAVAPFISSDIKGKLEFSLEIYDVDSSGNRRQNLANLVLETNSERVWVMHAASWKDPYPYQSQA